MISVHRRKKRMKFRRLTIKQKHTTNNTIPNNSDSDVNVMYYLTLLTQL